MEDSDIGWWLAITLFVAAALAYAYRLHKADSRRLAQLFTVLAAQYRGTMKKGSLFALPQLRFDSDRGHFLVAAMASSGSDSGDSGPFTLVDLTLPRDTGEEFRFIRRTASLIGVDRPTGHADFDAEFRVTKGEAALLHRLLNALIRAKLSKSRLPGLEVRLAGQKISVHMDGIARSKADLEELIAIATDLADRCENIK